MRNHLQEARWFIKSLQSRNETLLRVASAIVEQQRGFLEYGEEAMKPLVLRDIAEQLDMHESTISRVTTQKYMHTPRGIFEFKYFFSSHVGTADGGECSATAIRAMIKKLISPRNLRQAPERQQDRLDPGGAGHSCGAPYRGQVPGGDGHPAIQRAQAAL
jgi:RNA polymerase sigma-54 factor